MSYGSNGSLKSLAATCEEVIDPKIKHFSCSFDSLPYSKFILSTDSPGSFPENKGCIWPNKIIVHQARISLKSQEISFQICYLLGFFGRVRSLCIVDSYLLSIVIVHLYIFLPDPTSIYALM